jgi:hypothetical protein
MIHTTAQVPSSSRWRGTAATANGIPDFVFGYRLSHNHPPSLSQMAISYCCSSNGEPVLHHEPVANLRARFRPPGMIVIWTQEISSAQDRKIPNRVFFWQGLNRVA